MTYGAVAVGRVPGLGLDRTGIALCGAIAMLVFQVVPVRELGQAVHLETMLLLFGLMVLNAQYQLTGFYHWLAHWVQERMQRPRQFLLLTMGVSALGSALLVNDVVCLALTPVLALALRTSGLSPTPYLLGLAMASNIGSAATLIGNPQNMLIGQYGRLHFGAYSVFAMVPTLLSLACAYGVLLWLYRGRLTRPRLVPPGPQVTPELDRPGVTKALVLTAALLILFLTDLPRELTAMGIAGVVLLQRRHGSLRFMERIDWNLLVLFFGLFVVVHGIERVQIPAQALEILRHAGIDIRHPGLLTVVAAVLSNLVSNVPATMLMVRLIDPLDLLSWNVLAMATTFAGNLVTIGSIANLIVLEQAARAGIPITLREHAAAGIPITLLSLVVLVLWSSLW